MDALIRRHMPFVVLENLYAELIPLHRNKTELVYHLSDLLEVSNESIYRRLRGASSFTLEELWRIIQHYQISLDVVFNRTNSGKNCSVYHNTKLITRTQETIEKKGQPLSVIEQAIGIPLLLLEQLPTLRSLLQINQRFEQRDCPVSIVLNQSIFVDLRSLLVGVLHEGTPKTRIPMTINILFELANLLSKGFGNGSRYKFYHSEQLNKNHSLQLIYPDVGQISVYQIESSVIEFIEPEYRLDRLTGCVALFSNEFRSQLTRQSYVKLFYELGCDHLESELMDDMLTRSNLVHLLET